tara:strand:- start:2 stop:574 length:573 start_codon:yes stop_codon:yes gene_type:complete
MEITSATTFNQIYSQYKGLIFQLAKKYDKTSIYRSDLIQCGKIGIHISMEKWEPTKGIYFNCMYLYIKKEMLSFVINQSRVVRIPSNKFLDKEREHQPTDFVFSLDDTILDNGEPMYSTIAYEESDYIEEDTSSLRKAISSLKPKWKLIMNMVADGFTLTEIGKHIGMTTQAVSQQKQNAMIALQKIMVK